MILAKGKLFESSEQERILSGLEQEINRTRSEKSLDVETVIRAAEALVARVRAGDFDAAIASLDVEGAQSYKELAIRMLDRENLLYKLRTELGSESFARPIQGTPPCGLPGLQSRIVPLGTLLHIAAGNVEGLPAFSLAEGLLTGNVNLLKLPQADNGLSVEIIRTLIEAEPALADFIYVFDTPSSDVMAIKKLAELADGISVWGGDAAVSAVRRFAPCGAKLIEWGHKLSFAYVSQYRDKLPELKGLAEHIVATRQLLCSSCQVIYLDTHEMKDLFEFCEIFQPLLENAVAAQAPTTIGGMAEITLRKYNDEVEAAIGGRNTGRVGEFQGKGCSLTACTDSELELSFLFGNCLVKRLPRADMMEVLRRKKGYLQTAGLICADEERSDLTDRLIRCGLTRVMRAGDMSAVFSGEAHDGEYSLRRYVRVVNVEK